MPTRIIVFMGGLFLILVLVVTGVASNTRSAMVDFGLADSTYTLSSYARMLSTTLQVLDMDTSDQQLDEILLHSIQDPDTDVWLLSPSGQVVASSIPPAFRGPPPVSIPNQLVEDLKEIQEPRTTDDPISMKLELNGSDLLVYRPTVEYEYLVTAIMERFVLGGEYRFLYLERTRFLPIGDLNSLLWITLGATLVVASLSVSSLDRYYQKGIRSLDRGVANLIGGNLNLQLDNMESRSLKELAAKVHNLSIDMALRLDTIDGQRNELESMLNSMVEGIIIVDQKQKIKRINRAAAWMFSLPKRSYSNASLLELLRNSELCNFAERVFEDPAPLQDTVTIYGDRSMTLLVNGTQLASAGDDGPLGLLVLNDITRIKRLEEMRKDFVANVSHELRTPLTSIKGFLETLQDGPVDPETSQHFLGIIDKQADRLISIIEDLMYLSRLEHETEIETEPCSFSEILSNTVDLYRNSAEAKGQKLTIESEIQSVYYCNPLLMEQALGNLLDNGIKYTPKGGSIQIVARELESELEISISDSGLGIPNKDLGRIFERFYRVDKARSRDLGGTGLGLAIVRHVIRAHNGDISVSSIPGQGTTFSIHLPKLQALTEQVHRPQEGSE